MRLDSMRTRMTLVFSGALLIVMLLACSGMIAYAYHTATRSADAQLRTLAERIAHEWNEGDEGSDLQELIAEQRERGQNGDLAVLIVDAGGRVLQHSPGRLPPWPVQPDSGWRVLTRSVGANTAVVALPWNRTMDALRQQATLLALLCLVVVVVASFGAWLLVGRTLAPLGALSRQ